jgi:hypothetical protein
MNCNINMLKDEFCTSLNLFRLKCHNIGGLRHSIGGLRWQAHAGYSVECVEVRESNVDAQLFIY